MKRLLAASCWLLSSLAWAHSAARAPGEGFEDAARRNGVSTRDAPGDNAYDLRVAVDALDTSGVPLWAGRADVDKAFAELREARFLFEDADPAFARRSSWLYPDDGCFARAALAVDNLQRWGFAPTAKVFVFGELHVETANAPGGFVEWWYHVAPLVRLADGGLWVLDPAIDPAAPMAFKDWLSRQAADAGKVQAAICDAATYTPDDHCHVAPVADVVTAMKDQRRFLRREWLRQVDLGRDPRQVLGEAPVWRR
jgi:hypothetical protein